MRRSRLRWRICALALPFVAVGVLSACAKEQGEALGARASIVNGGELAFPGAKGFGRFAQGGRGGRVIQVTTLADSGPGSLRACIAADGPRVCVFRVSGVIRFTTERPMITNPYITIAGQTAPAGGILITHDGGAAGKTPIVVKDTHDVVIRHIRVRIDKAGENRGANDAFTIENSKNVIIDHVSGAWALDENVNTHGSNDAITISWSIFAEGIKDHDKCALLGSDSREPQNVSFLSNICAHNGDRSPEVNFPEGSCVEVANNILYNSSGAFLEIWESHGGTPVSVIGNHFRAGPDSSEQTGAIVLQTLNSIGSARVFLSDNRIDEGLIELNLPGQEALVEEPVCPLTHDPQPVEDAIRDVTDYAGALPHDAVDERVLREMQRRRGRLVGEPGVLPAIPMVAAPADTDGDGMEDSWEALNDANPDVADPWEDADADGWSNLDEYLDFAHQRLMLQARRN